MRRLLLVAAVALVATACPADDPTVAPEDAEEGEPTLQVLSPEDGATVEVPFELEFEVSGFELGDAPAGHIHVAWGDPEQDFVPVYPTEQAGTVTVDEFPEGTHDITVALANANHTVPDVPGATVLLRGITVAGEDDPDDDPPPAPQY
jgi:hypothetical protein